MKKIFSCCFLFAFFLHRANAQKQFTIVYNYQQGKETKDSFGFSLLKPLAEFGGYIGQAPFYDQKIISFDKKGNECLTVFQYDVRDTVCAVILDLFGHETFIIPDDTVHIQLIPKEKDTLVPFSASKFHFVYTGYNRFIYSLFDSLEYAYGDLRFIHSSIKQSNNNLELYYENITSLYNKRKRFIEKYCLQHLIPVSLVKMALGEIYSVYIRDLLSASFDAQFKLSDFPEQYISTIETQKFNDDDLYFKTVLYHQAAYSYWVFTANKMAMNLFSKNNGLSNSYQAIKTNLKSLTS